MQASTMASESIKMSVRDLNFYYGKFHAITKKRPRII